MDRAYRLTNVQRRDEWKSKYSQNGQPDMVDYAIALEGEQGWVKLSQKITTRPPAEGSELFGHIETRSTPNGQEYKKFVKGQQGQGGGGAPVNNEKLDYIIKMLEELTGRRQVVDEIVEPTKTELDDPFAGLGI